MDRVSFKPMKKTMLWGPLQGRIGRRCRAFLGRSRPGHGQKEKHFVDEKKHPFSVGHRIQGEGTANTQLGLFPVLDTKRALSVTYISPSIVSLLPCDILELLFQKKMAPTAKSICLLMRVTSKRIELEGPGWSHSVKF